ncbi:hypothetical protein QAD02_024071 [Eretmocerus hayati]|uniref:Uncharacterized protein n=1 Tax=Eretmocerus hayati TaxID=131215 RepID=A0ACC2PZC9_9HYME|nr:hypothetical protein QAD02_024071 [Eretmocerus hayati]
MSLFNSGRYILILTSLLLRNSSSEAHGGIKMSNETEIIEDETTTNYFTDIERNTAWFVGCDRALGRFEGSPLRFINCHLRVRKYLLDSTADIEKKCSFQMKYSIEGPLINFLNLKALRFGKEKYLVYWMETDYHQLHQDVERISVGIFWKFVIVDVNVCKNYFFQTKGTPFTQNYTPLDSFGGKIDQNFYHDIFVQDNRIDVFYSYLHKLNIIQESFNSTGHRIHGPAYKDHFEIDDDSEIVLEYKSNQRQWSLESRERFRVGDVCGGERVPCEPKLLKDASSLLSASRNAVTQCGKIDANSWNCTQQTQSYLNSYSNFLIHFDHAPHHIVIYDGVWNEGLLSFTSKHLRIFYLTLFDLWSKSYKPVLFASLPEEPEAPKGHFYLDNDYNICFHMSWTSDVKFNSLIKCYSKDLLTVKSEQT